MISSADKQFQANRLAGYVKTSAILWIAVAVLQFLCIWLGIWLLIAAIWNLVNAINDFKLEKKIINRDADVPQVYENITNYIIVGVINFLFGGILGLALLGFDLWIRSEILSHRDIFDNTSNVDNVSVAIRPSQARQTSLSDLEELEKVYELKQKGILTEEEFLRQKAIYMGAHKTYSGLDVIEELYKLKQKGILTEEEFAREKARLM